MLDMGTLSEKSEAAAVHMCFFVRKICLICLRQKVRKQGDAGIC